MEYTYKNTTAGAVKSIIDNAISQGLTPFAVFYTGNTVKDTALYELSYHDEDPNLLVDVIDEEPVFNFSKPDKEDDLPHLEIDAKTGELVAIVLPYSSNGDRIVFYQKKMIKL